MSAPEQPYFYHEPLVAYSDNLRLLRILRGCGNERIECELLKMTFPIQETYAALSYEWGESDSERIIDVNGIVFYTRPNLYDFLIQIRRQLGAELPLLLWVDAICIDQHNIQERSHQVTMMRRIFSEAHEVIIWLGQEAKNSTVLFNILNGHIGKYGNEDPRSSAPWPPRGIIKGLTEAVSDTTAWVAVVALARRSYWSRVWILQEIALAKKHRIFAGDCHLRNGTIVFLHTLTCHFKYIDLSSNPMANALYVWSHLYTNRYSYQLELWDLLQRLSFRCHSNVRHDKVYGLLGIAGDAKSFDVDYSISLHHLWLQIAASSPSTRICDIQTLRNFWKHLSYEEPETNQKQTEVLAWADHLYQLWDNKVWDAFRARDHKIRCFATQISNVQADDDGRQSSFTSHDQEYYLDSTEVTENGLWHCNLVSSNVSLFFSGSLKSPKFRAVALAMNRGTWLRESELNLDAFHSRSPIFDNYAQQGSLLSTTESPIDSFLQVMVKFDLIMLILASEPEYHPVQRSSNESICFRLIWPQKQNETPKSLD